MLHLRSWALVVLAAAAGWPGGPAWGWSEHTHRQMVSDATSSIGWLDSYGKLTPTPFNEMMHDVLGSAEPVGAEAFKFKDAATRQAKHDAYVSATNAAFSDESAVKGGDLRRFAQHLLLSPQTKLSFGLGEHQGRPVSARQLLSFYSSEPDSGFDLGLDASRDQKLMGGTDPHQTSSQGFRHMSFLFGKLGEAPNRAQLFFDLGQKAIAKGHPYWGFRMVAWGLHYLEDMGTPVHTNILPTLKYVRLKGLVRPVGEDGKRHFNRNLLGDMVRTSATINGNYHFLYEAFIEDLYSKGGPGADRLAAAAGAPAGGRAGDGASTVEKVARQRAWSRLSTPFIAKDTIRYFGDEYRRPAPGAPESSTRVLGHDEVQLALERAAAQRPGASGRAQTAARERLIARTAAQFQKNGAAIRQALDILHRGLPR